MNTKITNVPGRLHNVAVDEHGNPQPLTGANEIMDDSLGKDQATINSEVAGALETIDTRIANGVNTEKSRAQSVEATKADVTALEAEKQRAQEAEQQLRTLYQALTETETIPVSELPASGEANKIYRVAGDGNYSDYMWNGTEWVPMCTYDNDIDDEPTLGSNNLVKSGGVAGMYGHYTGNPEFLYVMTDLEQRILLALRKDGQVMFGAGVPYQVKEYVDVRIREIVGDDDLTEKIDSLKEIFAFLQNFKNSDTLKELLDAKVDKEEGKSLIDAEYADGISFIDNQEYVDVVTDAKRRIIEATKINGVKVFPAGIEAPNVPNYSKTVYVKKDGSGDFTKIVDALAYSNRYKDVTIVVSSGIYDLIEELGTDYFDSIPNSYYQGLKIGNGTTIKANGNGVVIKAQYTGSNVNVGYQFSLLNISGSCTIEGVSFIAQNTRYVIHDDPSDLIAESTDYVVTFRNCIFNHKGSTMYDVSQSRPISIGGGCHHGSMHIYDGCIFKTENDLMLADLSYHDSSNCYSKVVVSNCYFDRDKTIAGRSDVGGVVDWFVSNNRFGSNPNMRNPEYVRVVDFANIIETNN